MKQFAPQVSELIKRQTIRAHRKRHARPGEAVQLYVDQRLPTRQKLVNPDPTCISVEQIKITPLIQLPLPFGETQAIFTRVEVDGRILSTAELELLALADGFDCFESMRSFFEKTYGLPFEGYLIKWEPQC